MIYGPVLGWNADEFYRRALNQKVDFYPYDVERVFDPETKKSVKYLVKVALAGITRDEISVGFTDEGLLEIAVTPADRTDADVEVLRKSISYASKSITFDVPSEIDVKNVGVKYSDGLLTIELPLIVEKSKKRLLKIG